MRKAQNLHSLQTYEPDHREDRRVELIETLAEAYTYMYMQYTCMYMQVGSMYLITLEWMLSLALGSHYFVHYI